MGYFHGQLDHGRRFFDPSVLHQWYVLDIVTVGCY